MGLLRKFVPMNAEPKPKKPKKLGPFQFIVMNAVYELREEAHGSEIQDRVEEAEGGPVSIGAVYTTLSRLVSQGLLESWEGEPISSLSGKHRTYYRITGVGFEVLSMSRIRIRASVEAKGPAHA